jgi:pimeloyl-ACP methyl ester carboxylesterase
MDRIRLALGLLLLVLASLSAPSLAAPVEQSAWAGMKKDVRLANGVRLAYVELGDPKGKPLLLLHGYTDTSRSWSLAAPYLSRYRLIIPDQRGHGASDAPPCCYAPAALADDARQLLDVLGVQRAAVAGHSLGSMVAMELAAARPERVSGLVLVGSTGLVAINRWDWLYSQVMGLAFPLDPNSPFMRDWDPGNQPTPVDAAFAAAVRKELYAIPRHVWRGVLRELAGLPVARHAADVKAPVLLLSGGKDPIFPAEHHTALLKAFPGAEAHVFPQLGHNPNWEQAEGVARRIDAFLRAAGN